MAALSEVIADPGGLIEEIGTEEVEMGEWMVAWFWLHATVVSRGVFQRTGSFRANSASGMKLQDAASEPDITHPGTSHVPAR